MFLLLGFLFVVLGQCFCLPLGNITDCGSTATITHVSMSGCDYTPCHMTGGQSYTGYTVFTPRHNHNEAHFMVSGIIRGEDIPVKPRNNICGHGLNCPLQAGQQYNLTVTYDFPSYPNASQHLNVAGKYYLKDENDINIICVVLAIIFE
ncbi:Phosphatidylglycerol/phosphatidylinositol transfer protein [Mactra antiquata]